SIAENGREIQELYIHEKNCRQSRCVLAFNNIGFEDADKDERRILEDILDLIQDVLEKKVYYEMLQEQSMLDAFTNPGAMAGFIKRLEREIEKSKRSGVPMTLFTIEIPGFAELTKGLERQRVQAIRRFLWKVALHVTSKSDVVMRRDAASFVFLFKSARADKARRLQKAICRFLLKKLPKYLNSSIRLELATGLCQFDPNRDRTPDAFLAHAKPKKTWSGDKTRKPVVYLDKIQRKEIFEASQVNRNTAAL
ncbi:MAG: GGDEF domain-containing protein, partial [Deltaproteobacteria bacterium]|nr:GGDEF domain-containing protein [Deltaproteobacteria bacterium]